MEDKKIDDRALGNIVANLTDEIEDDEDYEDIEAVGLDDLIDIFGKDILEGINDVAKTIGQIHAFSLVGIEPQDALEYLLQLQVLGHEKIVLDETTKLQLQVSKIDGVKASKNEI